MNDYAPEVEGPTAEEAEREHQRDEYERKERDELDRLVGELRQARRDTNALDIKLAFARGAMELTPEYKAFEVARAELAAEKSRERTIYDAVCAQALLINDKRPHPYVTIKITKELMGYDEAEIREWAMRNAPMFLKLDVKTFESFAVKNPDKTPVTILYVPKATVATNLEAEPKP